MGGTCGQTGEKRNSLNILVVKHEGYYPFGRPRRIWEDKITTDCKGIGWDVEEIYLAQKREK
jgi:hypothetical protein